MSKAEIKREWMPYAKAAQEYLGVAPSILLGAIKAKELKAYVKPLTRGRTTADPDKQRNQYFVCLDDVNDYVRTYWKPAFDD